MHHHHKSIQAYTDKEFQILIQSIRKVSPQKAICQNPPCGSCRFSAVCAPPAPCSQWVFVPFLPLHILDAFTVLNIPVRMAQTYHHGRKFRILTDGHKVIKLSFVCFSNGQEPVQNALQLIPVDFFRFPPKETAFRMPISRWQAFLIPRS